jgi:amidophosphoribosyltransferase
MCGIVGLFLKSDKLEAELGRHLSAMLVEMTDRGPDSAGIALYGRPLGAADAKLTLYHRRRDFEWPALSAELGAGIGARVAINPKGNAAVATLAAAQLDPARTWLKRHKPDVFVTSWGAAVEIYKDMGLPKDVVDRYRLGAAHGTHGIGHTRMATESAVTTEHSHPFAAAPDICLVHNGSLSNHNRLRRWLERHGQSFESDNDTEVAARYFAFRLGEGATLKEAFEAGLKDLDGFYTFAIGTRDGFAVMRDSFACKPAVMAETDDWVAMGSEFRALAALPGIADASIWEPAPEIVYSWTRS